MKKYFANLITCTRIVGSILMIFLPVHSMWFYTIYLACGLSDMADGAVARMTKSQSAFDAKLDTVSDFVFVAVSLAKFLPLFHFPAWLLVWIGAVSIIKVTNVAIEFISHKRLLSAHTVMNKLTGLCLFLLPVALRFTKLKYSSVIVCALATVAAVVEWYSIKTNHPAEQY